MPTNRTAATRISGSAACVGNTACEEAVSVTASTNRAASNGGTSYDAAGNLTSDGSGGYQYTYDALNMMKAATMPSGTRELVYTADDERIGVHSGQTWAWTVRDLGGKPLREFSSTDNTATGILGSQNRAWTKDSIWRNGQLLAVDAASGTQHFHLDHLGTPRLVTSTAGAILGVHAYYAFGAELALSRSESPEAALKFTGHERDATGGSDALDYMHARYYSGAMGRFLSPDRGRDWNIHEPQSWNLYTYVGNNPLRYVDDWRGQGEFPRKDG
jgi:RHS repeat-associated protein